MAIIKKMFSFHSKKDEDVLKQLQRQPNASAYIRELIRNDIKGDKILEQIKQLINQDKLISDKNDSFILEILEDIEKI